MPSLEWHVVPTPEFIRSSHAYEKKHPDELAATLANLFHRYLPRLNHARRHGRVTIGETIRTTGASLAPIPNPPNFFGGLLASFPNLFGL